MQRPASITHFERSFWASILIGIIGSIISWRTMTKIVKQDPLLSQSADAAIMAIGFAVAISFALGGLLWYLIARRASNTAKWVYVALMAFGIISTLATLNDPMSPKGLALAMSLISTTLTALSIYFLFRPDAHSWFAGKNVDPAAFD